jgi:hypothetical protein
MTGHVEEHAFLSAPDCQAVLDQVHALQPYWCRRMEAAPFFTLGTAAYLDCVAPDNRYAAQAMVSNVVLTSGFGPLLAQLQARLEAILAAPVTYAAHLARPGFHIFLADRLFLIPIASVHFDLQYRLVTWPDTPAPDFAQPLSFTLPIALPAAGGGLNYACGPRAAPHSAAQLDRHQPYRVGHLYLHSGHLLHQIAPAADFAPDDQRVTLQGHAIRVGGVWQLYW